MFFISICIISIALALSTLHAVYEISKDRTEQNRWFVFLQIQYIPRNMHTVFALLCFVVVIHGLIFPYPSGLLHWHCGNLTIAPVPAKQPWWIWINTSCEFIINDCITTTKQSTSKPCAYFLGYTVCAQQYIHGFFVVKCCDLVRLSVVEIRCSLCRQDSLVILQTSSKP